MMWRVSRRSRISSCRRSLYACVLWLAAAVISGAPGADTGHAADTPFEFTNAQEAARFRVLATQLRCLVCQNQTIEDSHAPLAQDLRKEVLRLMREGRTDADIKRHLTQRYGDFVLYQPPVRPSTLVLWFGPLLLLLMGLVLAWRRWRAMHARGPGVLNDAERERALGLLATGQDAAAVAVADVPVGAALASPVNKPASGRAPGRVARAGRQRDGREVPR